MITSENMQEFAERLAEYRPSQVFSMMGTYNVEYSESANGEVAIIYMTLPEGMAVELENGSYGNVKAVHIALPSDVEDGE